MGSALRTGRVILLGALLMPLIGFVMLVALTWVPLIGLFIAPRWTIVLLYQAGFVPSLITVIAHVWLQRHPDIPMRTVIAGISGAVTCLVWYVVLGVFPALGWAQVYFCLIAAAVSMIYFRLMPNN